MSTHQPLRLPESMTRVDIGPYMRGLREHFGLSQQDVSERLHIRHRYINAIENGSFDQMPGRAYAKGYVHTYAEFLGLDAEQAVEICFGPEPVREQQKHFVPEPAKRAGGSLPGQWRTFAVAGVVVALAVLTIAQFTTGDDETETATTETVAEVPEDMLADMRRLLMPNAQNHDCLQAETPLGCILESREWGQLLGLMQTETVYFAEAAYASPLKETAKKPGKSDAKKPADDSERNAKEDAEEE